MKDGEVIVVLALPKMILMGRIQIWWGYSMAWWMINGSRLNSYAKDYWLYH